MLTLLILTMLFGGGTIEVFTADDQAYAAQAIEDPERAAAAIDSMERVNQKLADLEQQRVSYLEALTEVNERMDARAEDYDEIIDQLWDARRSALDTYVEEVFVLRETMTRGEWEVAFNAR